MAADVASYPNLTDKHLPDPGIIKKTVRQDRKKPGKAPVGTDGTIIPDNVIMTDATRQAKGIQQLRGKQEPDIVQPDHEAGYGDGGSDDDETAEEKEQDQRNRDALEKEGADEASRRFDTFELPPFVRQLWQMQLPVVQALWTREILELNKKEEEQLKVGQETIRAACEHHKHVQSTDYEFPMAEFRNKIMSTRSLYWKWKRCSEGEKQSASEALASFLYNWGIQLDRKYGLKWQYMVPDRVLRQLMGAIGDSCPDLRLQCEGIRKADQDIFRASSRAKAVQKFVDLREGTPQKDFDQTVTLMIEAFKEAQTELKKRQPEAVSGIAADLARLPFENAYEQVEELFEEEEINWEVVETVQESIYLFYKHNNLHIDLKEPAPDRAEESGRQMEAKRKEWKPKGLTSGPGIASSEPQRTTESPKPTDKPDSSFASMYDAKIAVLQIDARPDYTSLGKIMYVNRMGYGYRAVINRSTDERPIGVSVTASELGFESKKLKAWYDKHVEEQGIMIERLREDPKAIKRFLDCVEIPWKKDTSRKCRAYHILKTQDDVVVCITHSDLVKMCKLKAADEYRKKLVLAHDMCTIELDRLKGLSLHPDTNQPLTDDERARMPWLSSPSPVGGPKDTVLEGQAETASTDDLLDFDESLLP